MSKVDIGERLKQIRKVLGNLSVKKFADGAGLSDYKVRDCELGRQRFDDEILSAIGNFYNVNIDWLLRGTGAMFIGQIADSVKKVKVNYYPEVSAAMGYGAINSDLECIKYEISADLLETMGIKDSAAVDLIKVYGDSMEPFASSGESVFVERVERAESVKNNAVAIVNIEGEVYLKRFVKDPLGRWYKLRSENPAYADIDLRDNFAIIGVVRGKFKPFV
ncbi:MAG: hypothetical protein LBO72_09725 [Helicobacteraceae bacterium]|jgi:phage repressor protein C with HTH and peptisase S24 domain|nr:hypothetical protein [Helicobacteraceae bacterium]